MTENYRKYVYIIGLCFIIFSGIFSGAEYIRVDLMEARNFITAREMISDGNWLLPTLNGDPRLAKPPLPTWLTAVAMKAAGTDNNLFANRLPAGFSALLMVALMFSFVKSLTKSRDIALYSAIVLTTSYMFMYMARKGTWDIFAHSFMLGAIWLYHEIVVRESKSYLISFFAGVLLGLSWMSKGPVSFYALLLPFIISHSFFYRSFYSRKLIVHMGLMLMVFMLISLWWPLYVYFSLTARAEAVAAREATAWFSRHVKPVWYYIHFPAMSGIWLFMLLPMLFPAYARRKVTDLKNYKMVLFWLLLMIAMLSIIPEKKDRYLLPSVVPMTVIIAFYLRYLVNAIKKQEMLKSDKIIMGTYVLLSAVLSLLVTVSVAYDYYRNGLADDTILLFITALVSNYTTYRSIRVRSGSSYIYSVVITFVVLINVVPPLAKDIKGEKNFMRLQELRPVIASEPGEVYVANYSLKEFWAVGRVVNPVNDDGIGMIDSDKPFWFLSKRKNLEPVFKKQGFDYSKYADVKGEDGKVIWTLYRVSK